MHFYWAFNCEKPKGIIQIVSHLNECFMIAILIRMLITLFNRTKFTAPGAHIDNKCFFSGAQGQNI